MAPGPYASLNCMGKGRVIVAMSGGVDSLRRRPAAVAAGLRRRGRDDAPLDGRARGRAAAEQAVLLRRGRRGRAPRLPDDRRSPLRDELRARVPVPRRRLLLPGVRPGTHAAPLPRLQRQDQVRLPAAPGHVPRRRLHRHRPLRPHRGQRSRQAAAEGRRRPQGPVVRAVHARPARARPPHAAHRRLLQGPHPRDGGRGRASGRRQARQPGDLLHTGRRLPQVHPPTGAVRRPARSSTRRGKSSASIRACSSTPSASAGV